MKSKIITQMRNIVADVMTSFQTDFENYDRPYIESDECQFPLIWIVGESHTFMLKLGEYRGIFFNNESARFAYSKNPNVYGYHLEYNTDDNWFLITKEGVTPITLKQAESAIKDYVIPAVKAWEAEYGPLPKVPKLPVRFQNITLSKLKELIIDCHNHDDDSLMDCLKRFHLYTRCATDQYIEVNYNPGYNEFVFSEHTNGKVGLVGGIVFHGWPEIGYSENGSVQLSPRYGWSTHT